MDAKNSFIIFGGSGFIGYHYYKYLSKSSDIKIIDIKKPKHSDNSDFIFSDVRKPININLANYKTIINLAAVHATPGHEEHEYYETNVNGAINICNFARANNVNNIIFTSSISTYGTHEDEKNEDSLLMPTSPYGISKLIAETIRRSCNGESLKALVK